MNYLKIFQQFNNFYSVLPKMRQTRKKLNRKNKLKSLRGGVKNNEWVDDNELFDFSFNNEPSPAQSTPNAKLSTTKKHNPKKDLSTPTPTPPNATLDVTKKHNPKEDLPTPPPTYLYTQLRKWANELPLVDPTKCGKLAGLAIPLFGVRIMLFCKSKTKSILLIGESHREFKQKSNFPPITDIILDVLQTGDHLDFMFEIRNNYVKPANPHTVLGTLQPLLAPYIFGKKEGDEYKRYKQFKSSRVHWLDKQFKGTKHVQWLTDLEYYLNVNYFKKIIDIPPSVVQHLINQSQRNADSFAMYMATIAKELPEYQLCIDRKIYNKQSFINMFKLIHQDRDNIQLFLLNIYRFFMDMYTVCRLLKTDGEWYKNIAVYAGSNHVLRIGTILQEIGFTVNRVNVKIDPDLSTFV